MQTAHNHSETLARMHAHTTRDAQAANTTPAARNTHSLPNSHCHAMF